MPKRGSDGLTRTERYRLKDVDGYRKRKAEFARTPVERAKRTEYMRGWREKNRARHNELCRASQHRNKHKHKDRNRDLHLRRTFGITLADKQALIDQQGGACWICREPFRSSRDKHVDHCHRTKRVRGVLCHRCNTKLGWFEVFGDRIREYLATV